MKNDNPATNEIRKDSQSGGTKLPEALRRPDPESIDRKDGYIIDSKIHPWRRFFARALDTLIYFLICALYAGFVGRYHIAGIVPMQLSFRMLLVTTIVEPLFLRIFGTTIGKWCMGMKIVDRGGKPTYFRALLRSLVMAGIGLGAYLPWACIVLPLIWLWRYHKVGRVPWEENILPHNEYKVDFRPKVVEYALAIAGCAAVFIGSTMYTSLPPHSGDITVSQYAENFDYISRYYYGLYYESLRFENPYYRGDSEEYKIAAINENGEWVAGVGYPSRIIYSNFSAACYGLGDCMRRSPQNVDETLTPVFSYEFDDGKVKSVRITASAEGRPFSVAGYGNLYKAATLALAKADGMSVVDYSVLRYEMWKRAPFESYTITRGNITVTVSVEYSYLAPTPDDGNILLSTVGDEDCSFSTEFTVSINDG